MLISSKLNDILSLIYYEPSVCLTTDFLGHLLCCWRGDPRITVQMPCMLGCVWYDMIGFAAGGASANHLLFSFSLQLQEECMRVHIMSGCEFACVRRLCVCVRALVWVGLRVCPVSCSAGGWRHAYVCALKLARYPIVCVLLAFMRCDSQLQGPLTLMMPHSARDSCRN